MTPRAASPEVKSAIIREMRWYDAYLDRGGADRSANPTPGNKRGGLANIVEKAMGSIAKSGSSPIAGVLSPGERARGKGMIFAATPASDFVCGTEQARLGHRAPGLFDGARYALWTCGGPGDQGVEPFLAGAPLARLDRCRRRQDSRGRGNDRGSRAGALRDDGRHGLGALFALG